MWFCCASFCIYGFVHLGSVFMARKRHRRVVQHFIRETAVSCLVLCFCLVRCVTQLREKSLVPKRFPYYNQQLLLVILFTVQYLCLLRHASPERACDKGPVLCDVPQLHDCALREHVWLVCPKPNTGTNTSFATYQGLYQALTVATWVPNSWQARLWKKLGSG